METGAAGGRGRPLRTPRREIRALDGEARLLPGPGGAPRDILRALRPHQWVENRPELLWPMGPLLLYSLGRVTLLAHRGSVDADPVVFAMRDGASRLTAIGILAVFIAAL